MEVVNQCVRPVIPMILGLSWSMTFHAIEESYWMSVTFITKQGPSNLTYEITFDEYKWWLKICEGDRSQKPKCTCPPDAPIHSTPCPYYAPSPQDIYKESLQ